MIITFSPQPDASDLPARMPSPFDRAGVHPLAQRAAADQIAQLRTSAPTEWKLDEPYGGKMFGVLVVAAPNGTIGYLRAFSGMLDGAWCVPGWAPPLFDAAAHDALRRFAAAELRAFDSANHATVSAALTSPRSATISSQRGVRANGLLTQLQAEYSFPSARGNRRTMREIFAPAMPPGGAGDCAAPKLLAHAYRLGLRPIALAEFWWGAMPRSGDRRAGSFYPACRGKCGPILAHMLDGLPVDTPADFGTAIIESMQPVVVFEDQWIVIVEKPCGMLSVPGRSAQLHDSVLTRLRSRYPDATGPLLVHRLDLDTSGLLLAAKDIATYAALQRCFAQREIEKRYIAVLDGSIRDESGQIDLPLRVDVDDRPRQIHDPEYGKRAVTEWQVQRRDGERTRVILRPLTGRTHQLRVHASHPAGLDAPIVGDRLYGRFAPEDGERLLLHAEGLRFVHPVTRNVVAVERLAPF